jgi:hypothetical protein
VKRHEFLAEIHRRHRPRNYLEIGVSDGKSLALSRVPSVAIDPDFHVTRSIRCDVHLVRATSDDFFARPDALHHLHGGRNPIRNLRRGRPLLGHWLGEPVLDLAFIDGMHLFEYVLRDFIYVERVSGPASVIVLDDIYPRSIIEAARHRETRGWTGDVFKIVEVLRRHRPDLVVLPMNTAPTGVLVVLGADPQNRVLRNAYERLVAEHVQPDPQDVPKRVLERQGAIDPQAFLDSPIIATVVAARRPLAGRSTRQELHAMAMELGWAGR